MSDPNALKAFGIDVSHHQAISEVHWPTVQQTGIAFVFVKVSEGMEVDPTFASHWAGAKSVGLPRGPYHFFSPRFDAAAQASVFARLIADDPGELPPILDVEAIDGVDNATLIHAVEIWLNEVEDRLKQRPLIYTGTSVWDKHMRDPSGLFPPWANQYQLWLGQYPFARDVQAGKNQKAIEDAKKMGVAPPPPPPLPPLPDLRTVIMPFSQQDIPKSWSAFTFWQYTGQGSLLGISGPVDQDVFSGTPEEFEAWARRELALRGMPQAVRSAAANRTATEAEAAGTAAAANLLITNQFMINVFFAAARRQSLAGPALMDRTGVSLAAMVNPPGNRNLAYTGPRIEDLLNLSADERKALVFAFFTEPPTPPMTVAPSGVTLAAG